jgi:hypothetical protein
MKMRYMLIPIAMIVCSVVFLLPSPASAQYCGMPTETTTITTSSGTELEIDHRVEGGWGSCPNSVTVVGDGFCVYMSWPPDCLELLTIDISNGDSSWSYGQGVISLEHSFNYIQNNKAEFDSSAWPPEYRELWAKAESVCGELLECPEFWDMLDELDKDAIEELRGYMGLMRDGVCDAYTWEQLFSIQPTLRALVPDNRLARGYYIDGPVDMTILTPSPYGDENPEIVIMTYGTDSEDRWSVDIDPVEEVCTVSWMTVDPVQPVTEEDWRPWLAELRSLLGTYHRLLPSLVEHGVVEPDGDLVLLIEKSIAGLAAYPAELEYKLFYGDTIL